MKGKIFLDTNVLIYAYSLDDERKREKCLDLIREHEGANQLVWSTQVVQEFYVVLTKKFGLPPLHVREILDHFGNFELVTNDYTSIIEAINTQVLYQYSFWDSLLISAAQRANCTVLYSEDLHTGHQLGKLEIVNPFL